MDEKTLSQKRKVKIKEGIKNRLSLRGVKEVSLRTSNLCSASTTLMEIRT